MEKYLIGIDIGTTATKLVLVHKEGTIVNSVSRPVTLYTLRPGWSEEDPREWWDNVKELLPILLRNSNVSPEQISAVGVSGMVPTLICLDKNGEPIRYSIQQNDARASKEIIELANKTSEYNIFQKTGSEITQQSIAPKIMWLKKHEPAVLDETVSICGSYDYITRRLTGNQKETLEANWALESGLYNYQTQQWDNYILEKAGIKTEWLGEVYSSHQLVGTVQGNHGTCLKDGTPVVAGAADHVASAFSAGLIEDGDLLIKLGGAGDILLSSSIPISDSRLYLDYHLVPGYFLPNGCMASSGSLIRWFQKQLANGIPLEILDQEAEETAIGSDGLITLPYFLGEKTPINDTKARGMFIGLNLSHTRAHIYRSILEGIGFGFKHHLEVFRELGTRINRVRITNGGSKSRFWRQIISDITGLTLESIIEHPGSSLGAAFIAGMGVGEIKSWSEIDKFIKIEEKIEPREENIEKYKVLYDVYRSIYPKLIKEQHILADFIVPEEGNA
ncbi:FGGY-family carbohydrate kinase [Neobacillus terrae]|uniref:FGGY-family carbohydrate kinase n=1 Tax=Neobacillus terrae TaxID=3034837 RepID=UPI001407B6AF|nr:FGGY-family carbohydrate kinase [Neobacillus terrae]NHM32468.1 FGGY-family carbohydrate kinase [Neobacillus terrae]